MTLLIFSLVFFVLVFDSSVSFRQFLVQNHGEFTIKPILSTTTQNLSKQYKNSCGHNKIIVCFAKNRGHQDSSGYEDDEDSEDEEGEEDDMENSAIVSVARSLIKRIFFYGLDSLDLDERDPNPSQKTMRRRKKLEELKRKKWLKRNTFYTESELIAQYLISGAEEKDDESDSTEEAENNEQQSNSIMDLDYFLNGKQVITDRIDELNRQLMMLDITLQASDNDSNDKEIMEMKSRKMKLEDQINKLRIDLITISATIEDFSINKLREK